MTNYSLSHVADHVLIHNLATLVDRDRKNTAALLAHIAEVDSRQLYRPAGFPSMHAYCVGELRLSDEAAFKRIRAARMARDYPASLPAVAEGRLHLTALVLLSTHLNEHNAAELLTAAENKRRIEIEQWLAERFPRPDLPTRLRALPDHAIVAATEMFTTSASSAAPATELRQLSPGTVLFHTAQPLEAGSTGSDGAIRSVEDCRAASAVPTAVEPNRVIDAARAKVTPLAPRRFALQVTIDQITRDKLRRVQELMSHQLPSGDVAQVLDRALDSLLRELEKAKCAATDAPRASRRGPKSGARYVSASVTRAVWKRDGGQCTFVSENGRRCSARKFLELDHVDEVARGGYATVERMRLRCRAHNQYTAEQTFGAEFMRHKRLAASEARGGARGSAAVGSHGSGRWRPAEGAGGSMAGE